MACRRVIRADAETGLSALTLRWSKNLCMAGKRFDSTGRRAIDHRQPY
jgi:hypothetical protein